MKLWIARDDSFGELCLFNKEPYLNPSGVWTCENQEYIILPRDKFPQVTFENSPQQVEIKLIENE